MLACDYRDFFFFNDTATTEIYTLSLHDALPISFLTRKPMVFSIASPMTKARTKEWIRTANAASAWAPSWARSEEHTSELQSRQYLVCRLLLEKKKTAECIVQLMRAHELRTALYL